LRREPNGAIHRDGKSGNDQPRGPATHGTLGSSAIGIFTVVAGD
jgi:hypothetical protein